MTLRTTGEGGAVAVGVSATREAERASIFSISCFLIGSTY